jgi:hypothetical protein
MIVAKRKMHSGGTAQQIYNLIKRSKNGMTISKIAQKLGISYNRAYQSITYHADMYVWYGSRGRNGYVITIR